MAVRALTATLCANGRLAPARRDRIAPPGATGLPPPGATGSPPPVATGSPVPAGTGSPPPAATGSSSGMRSRGIVTCAIGPIPSAYTTVPTPTVPPSSQPVTRTVSSIEVRTMRIE